MLNYKIYFKILTKKFLTQRQNYRAVYKSSTCKYYARDDCDLLYIRSSGRVFGVATWSIGSYMFKLL